MLSLAQAIGSAATKLYASLRVGKAGTGCPFIAIGSRHSAQTPSRFDALVDFTHLVMLPMSAMSAIVPLLLLVSVSLAAELELEDGCLLQTKEQQLLVKEQLRVCDPLPQEECCCCELVTQPTGDTNLADCAASCTNYSGFIYSELPWHVCRCCNNADPTCDELDYPPRSPLESNVLVFTMRISGTIITQEIVDPCSLVCFSEFLVCFDLWFAYVCMFGAEPRFQEI